MTLDKLLSLCLPRLSGRTGEKYNLYRQFISASLMWERWKLAGDNSKPPADFTPTKDEVDAQLAKDKSRPFSQWESIQCRHAFLEWYRTQHPATVSSGRRVGGLARQAQRKAALERQAKAKETARKPRPQKKLKKRL